LTLFFFCTGKKCRIDVVVRNIKKKKHRVYQKKFKRKNPPHVRRGEYFAEYQLPEEKEYLKKTDCVRRRVCIRISARFICVRDADGAACI